jgi:hypothetical protein
MASSFRSVAIGVSLAACVLAQFGVQARAQDSGSTPPIVTKAPANPTPTAPAIPYGDVTFTGTGLAVTNGFSNRAVAELAANWYYAGLGVHFDDAGVWREERADFAAVGVSYAVTPYIRPKVWYGTSTNNLGIEPQTYVRGEVAFQTPSTPGAVGIVATPAITSNQYRNGVQELDPQIDVAFYHPEFANHAYLVTEVTATTVFVQSLSSVGYEFAGSETYVMPRWGTIGAQIFGGRMVYDVTLCVALCSVQNNFVGIRPLISFYLNPAETLELYFRGEITATDFYNIYGGTVGLKTRF